jgi:hypothetical protein
VQTVNRSAQPEFDLSAFPLCLVAGEGQNGSNERRQGRQLLIESWDFMGLGLVVAT